LFNNSRRLHQQDDHPRLMACSPKK